jgi:hypothetical protein
MKIIEVEKIRDILVMKLFSNDNSKHGLCLTFFFIPPIIVAQLNILSNFGSKLGKNWEEIGRKKYKQKQCNLSLHEIDGGIYNE